ncbi:MAG: hypothetical protein NTY80_01075 [candidate division SR1 bacterium]|nr:hypothetical protein [candidate division SR1 bacterium]
MANLNGKTVKLMRKGSTTGKPDLIEGIIVGSSQTKYARTAKNNKPAEMILRLKKIEENTACKKTRERAMQAIEIFSKLKVKALETPMSLAKRKEALAQIPEA